MIDSYRQTKTPAAARRIRAWFTFLAGGCVLGFFAFGVIPWLNACPPNRGVTRSAKLLDIDASALFYTDVEEVGQAVNELRNRRRYSASPGSPNKPADRRID